MNIAQARASQLRTQTQSDTPQAIFVGSILGILLSGVAVIAVGGWQLHIANTALNGSTAVVVPTQSGVPAVEAASPSVYATPESQNAYGGPEGSPYGVAAEGTESDQGYGPNVASE